MKTWGILGALDAEVALLLDQMEVEETVTVYGSTYYQGTLRGKRVVLACCGIGKVAAALCAHVMLRELGADVLVNVGIAGAMRPGLAVKDVVIGDELIFHDFDEELLIKYYPHCSRFAADKELAALCERACRELGNVRFCTGRIVSGDVFVSDSALKRDIAARYSPACVEMEGAAVAQVAHMSGKPFLVVRTMSDTADDSAEELYDNFFAEAADQSAHILLKMLSLAE